MERINRVSTRVKERKGETEGETEGESQWVRKREGVRKRRED